MIVNDDIEICPNCGSKDFSKDWRGYLLIIDPTKSQLAKKAGITLPGKYALRVR
jgi:DNA-directed RNA polymerase subunit E"